MSEKKNFKQTVKDNWKAWVAIVGGVGLSALTGYVFYEVGFRNGYFTREGEIENMFNSTMSNNPLMKDKD